MRQLFIDLDGVLADFDGGYRDLTGHLPDRDGPEPPDFWDPIRAHGSFFSSLKPMRDAYALWLGAHWYHPNPIILTGVPKSVPGAADQKVEWVAKNISEKAAVICCQSAHKRKHGKPGDVLVDDWPKYKHLWEKMGGVFVLHASASDSLTQLNRFFVGGAR